MPRVYISPSSQYSNVGLAPFTTEGAEMSLIASSLMLLLVMDGRYTAKCSTPEMTDVYEKARDSNDFGADIHVAIHSNAGGGQGTEVYAYGIKSDSERLALALYSKISPLSPGADRGIKYNPKLIEVGNCVKAHSALIELAFHDNAADANWLATGTSQIAHALYQGICDYYSYDYRDTPSSSGDLTYLIVSVPKPNKDVAIAKIEDMGYAVRILD